MRSRFTLTLAFALFAAVVLSAASFDAHGEGTVVDDAAIADESDGNNWLAYGKTHSEKRSTLR